MRQKIQEELKQEVIKKIYQEFTDYRSNLRNESSSNLIAEAYKIETFYSLYEVLMEKSTQLSDVALLNLLNMGTGILEGLYEKWLGVKDSSYDELENYVEHELDELEGYGLSEAV